MIFLKLSVPFFILLQSVFSGPLKKLPDGFVYLNQIDNSIIESSIYSTEENFTGKIIPGYKDNRIICTKKAALSLKKVQEYLKKKGYCLVVYDGYRPQKAVDYFEYWSGYEKNERQKANYYPNIDKIDCFKLGYIAKKSSHSRGSTFDLTIITIGEKPKKFKRCYRLLTNGRKVVYLDDGTVDMGGHVDYFDEVSHHGAVGLNNEQKNNRLILKEAMVLHGFDVYSEEWWHYTLKNEPFPNTYFDFLLF